MPRVISLVPSLTETALGLGLGPDELIGRTSFCIHPQPLVRRIPLMGGTKTPRIERIIAQRPDLVLLDRDENRIEDGERLREAGLELFVVDLGGIEPVVELLRELGERLHRADAARRHAGELETALAATSTRRAARTGAGKVPLRCLPLVWNEPLMAAAPDRYCGGVLAAAGFEVPRVGVGRYPRVDAAALAAQQLDVLLLPSEPHPFTPVEGERVSAAIVAAGGRAPALRYVDGDDLFWYGVRSARAVRAFERLAEALEGEGSSG